MKKISQKANRKTTKTQIKDGWHTWSGYDVYVDEGKAVRARKEDRNGSPVSAAIYKKNPSGDGVIKTSPENASTVMRGLREGRRFIK